MKTFDDFMFTYGTHFPFALDEPQSDDCSEWIVLRMAGGLFIMVIVLCFPSPTLFANPSIWRDKPCAVRPGRQNSRQTHCFTVYEEYDTAAHLQALIQDVTPGGEKSLIMTWKGPAKLGPDNLIIFYFNEI